MRTLSIAIIVAVLTFSSGFASGMVKATSDCRVAVQDIRDVLRGSVHP